MTAAVSASRQHWLIASAVAMTLIIQTTISLLRAGIPVLAPEIAAERGLSTALVAFYSPIACIAAFIVSFFVPALLSRIGGMALCLVCVALSALGLLCLLPPSTAVLAAAPILIGLAGGAMNPASSQILAPRTTARTAGLIMSLKQTGVPLGGALAGIVLPFLALRWAWDHAVIGLAFASAGLILLCLPTVRWFEGPASSAPPARRRPLEPVNLLLAIPGMLGILVAATVFTGMQHCLRSFFTVYLVDSLGLPLTVAGAAFAVSQVAGMVGQVGWAVMSDRALGTHPVMWIIGVVMTLAAGLTAMMTPHWPVVALFVVSILFGVSAAGFLPVVLAEVARRSPAGQAGALTSGANLFITGGAFVGPLVFGFVGAVLGYAAAFAVAAACALGASIVVARPQSLGARAVAAETADPGQ